MSISFAGYSFDGPFSTADRLENRAGVYVVLCPTGNNRYKLTDVGEASEVKKRIEEHDRKDCWSRHCSSRYYGAHYTPNTQQSGRREIEGKIRDQCNPPCGEQ